MTAPKRTDRALLIIGGHEEKEGDKLILRAFAERVKGGKLVVVTAATNHQRELSGEYERVFRGLGVKHIYNLAIESREDAKSARALRILDDAVAIFFTGGDQLKITSQLGSSPVAARIREIYDAGGTIAGTSAGASVLSESMMVEGQSDQSHRIGASLHLAPGLGLLEGTIVDQHFAERGRIGRLIGAVAQNPRILGIGVDENTAVLVERERRFTVIGDGGVYIVDGSNLNYSNLTDEETDRTLSVFDVRLHVLSQGDTFDFVTRTPTPCAAEVIEEELLGQAK